METYCYIYNMPGVPECFANITARNQREADLKFEKIHKGATVVDVIFIEPTPRKKISVLDE